MSIEAFEHFGFERYDDFFKNCFDILPDDGRMTIQSSVGYHPYDLAERGKKLTFELARFIKFMITEIFPGGRIPTTADDGGARREGRLRGARDAVAAQPLHQDARHLGRPRWKRNKDEAIAATDEENYNRYMKYLKRLPVLLHRREPSTSAWSPT